MFCHNCGEKAKNNSQYCHNCGNSLSSSNSNNKSNKTSNSINTLIPRNKTQIFLVVVTLLLVVSGIANAQQYQKNQELKEVVEQTEKQFKTTSNNLDKCQKELSSSTEKIALLNEDMSGLKKEKQNLRDEADRQKAIAANQRQEANQLRAQKNKIESDINELEKQKQKIQDDLGGCRYVLNITGELVSVLEKQRNAYEKATSYSNEAALTDDYSTAMYYIDKMGQQIDVAESYQSKINSLISQLQ
ncbi:MAG: hypothetical protein ABEJ24_03940 [Candidatus Magasanikbacteria bacterium]